MVAPGRTRRTPGPAEQRPAEFIEVASRENRTRVREFGVGFCFGLRLVERGKSEIHRLDESVHSSSNSVERSSTDSTSPGLTPWSQTSSRCMSLSRPWVSTRFLRSCHCVSPRAACASVPSLRRRSRRFLLVRNYHQGTRWRRGRRAFQDRALVDAILRPVRSNAASSAVGSYRTSRPSTSNATSWAVRRGARPPVTPARLRLHRLADDLCSRSAHSSTSATAVTHLEGERQNDAPSPSTRASTASSPHSLDSPVGAAVPRTPRGRSSGRIPRNVVGQSSDGGHDCGAGPTRLSRVQDHERSAHDGQHRRPSAMPPSASGRHTLLCRSRGRWRPCFGGVGKAITSPRLRDRFSHYRIVSMLIIVVRV